MPLKNQLIQLKKWFLSKKRDLPWRQTNDPYAIWISEIMLQQTQVSVVIPYFEKWMTAFPTVQKLASSDIDTIIKIWEGLGYYSRARNLHLGAKYLVEHHNGILPDSEIELQKIKGIGPYTLGAILSFAFHKKKAAVDGNVIRVLTRLFNLDLDVSKHKNVKQIHNLAESILPDFEPWIIAEALIELGATVCTKKPKCKECPLKTSCKSALHGTQGNLPVKSLKIKTEYLFRHAFLIFAKNKLLVKRGKPGEIMSDLYEFPFLEAKSKDELLQLNQNNLFGISLLKTSDFEEVNHSFTRYRVSLSSSLFKAKEKPIQDYEWKSIEELDRLSFSSGHKKLFLKVKAFINIPPENCKPKVNSL